jgi:hypothetical protein
MSNSGAKRLSREGRNKKKRKRKRRGRPNELW